MTKPSREASTGQGELYTLLETLDRLEELLEDMDEFGVASRDDIEVRMREIHARVDELEQTLPSS